MSKPLNMEFDFSFLNKDEPDHDAAQNISHDKTPCSVKEISDPEQDKDGNGFDSQSDAVKENISDKIELSENALTVLKRRYLRKDDEAKIIETPEELFRRVARCIAGVEKNYFENADVHALENEFFDLMTSFEFLPNSPTLMNGGKPNGQLSACFVLPVKDSMESIFDTIKNAALIHKTGGGTGFSFSQLRPNKDVVLSTRGVASGPISFMTVFDSATEAVKQGGTRRGANMGILRIDHPDIINFITCKYDNDRINNFNISVALTEDFMKCVENDGEYDLINPRTKKSVEKIKARKVFDLIINLAWKNGDPGIIFLDRINRDNPTPEVGEIESTNPCGEQPLLPYESCNLGSVNFHKMINTADDGTTTIDYEKLKQTIHKSVHFLDNVIEANTYPLPQIDEMTKANRKIGLGVMGFADLLIELGIPYNSDEALQLADELMSFINKEAKSKSMELAKTRGAFPNFEKSIYANAGLPEIRNSTVTTIAPTGTISIIANSSSGIEPIFAVSYYRKVMDDDILLEVHPQFEKIAKERGFYSTELMNKIAEHGSIQDIDEIPDDVKRIFVAAHDISPEWHVRMQAAFQQHVDNAVSKTVNFPNDARPEDIENVYFLAYQLGCKGATVFRDGCRETQVLNVHQKQKETKDSDSQQLEIIPRDRGKVTYGITEKLVTSDGTLYITINQDEHGLCEIFCNIGKHGSDAGAWSEAVGRLISLCLRSGISLKHLVSQLRGITSRPIWQDGEQILSVPDAIGKALSRYLDHNGDQLPIQFADDQHSQVLAPFKKNETEVKYMTCPDCGSPVEHEGGCVLCRSCGYSKCE